MDLHLNYLLVFPESYKSESVTISEGSLCSFPIKESSFAFHNHFLKQKSM